MHAMMAYKGVGPYLHSLLTAGLDKGESAVSRLGRFVLDKEFQYPLNMPLHGTQRHAQRFRKKIFFILARIQISNMLAPSLDTIPTTGSYMEGINTLCDKIQSFLILQRMVCWVMVNADEREQM